MGPQECPDPFAQIRFANALDARRFLAKTLGRPLGLLPAEHLKAIDEVLSTTLEKSRIVDALKGLLERQTC